MKIALMLPNPNDATSMARGAMPMALLARVVNGNGFSPEHSPGLPPAEPPGLPPAEPRLGTSPAPAGEGLELLTREAWSWSDVCQCDLVFIQRPFTADHYQLAVMAKQVGLPLWVDYDDALDVLPQSNPLWSMKFAADAAANMNACCQLADVVSVTTRQLGERVSAMMPTLGLAPRKTPGGGTGPTSGEGSAVDSRPRPQPTKVRVIPNAHNDYLLPFIDTSKCLRQKIVTWRGSATHDEDLQSVLPQLVEVANAPEFASWKFAFLGDTPWEVRKLMPKNRTLYSAEGWKNYFTFMNEWAGCCPAIHLVPLIESEFNRCKSNLAWLEATAVGAVTLAPAGFEEFFKPGVWRYGVAEPRPGDGGECQFAATLANMMREFDQKGQIAGQMMPMPQPNLGLASALAESRDYILGRRRLSQVNELRLQVILDLVKAPASKFA